jgi:hypothetical protein
MSEYIQNTPDAASFDEFVRDTVYMHNTIPDAASFDEAVNLAVGFQDTYIPDTWLFEHRGIFCQVWCYDVDALYWRSEVILYNDQRIFRQVGINSLEFELTLSNPAGNAIDWDSWLSNPEVSETKEICMRRCLRFMRHVAEWLAKSDDSLALALQRMGGDLHLV